MGPAAPEFDIVVSETPGVGEGPLQGVVLIAAGEHAQLHKHPPDKRGRPVPRHPERSRLICSVVQSAVIPPDLHGVAVDGLDVGVDALGDGVGHQMGEIPPKALVDAGQSIVPGVDDGVVGAHPGQESDHPLAERALGILAHKDRHRGVPVHDLQHAVEKFGGVDTLGPDPVLFLPVAHGVRIGGAVLIAGAHEVVELVVMVLLGEGQAEGVGRFLHLRQVHREVGVQLGVVLLIFRKLAVAEHQAVGHHEEFELFVGGIGDLPVHPLGKLRGLHVDEAQHPGPVGLCLFHGVHHLDRAAGDRGDDHHRAFAHPAVAGGEVLCGILHKELQCGALLHVDLGLEAGGVGPSNAQPADVLEAGPADVIHDRLDPSPQGQGALDAGDLFFFVKFQHVVVSSWRRESLADFQLLIIVIVDGEGVAHVLLEEYVLFVREVAGGVIAVGLGGGRHGGVVGAGVGELLQVFCHDLGVGDVVEKLFGQIHVLGAGGDDVEIKAQLHGIAFEVGHLQCVLVAQFAHGPGGVAVISEGHAGRAVGQILLGGAVGHHVVVILGQPLVGRGDLLLVGGVGVIAQGHQGDGEQVTGAVDSADLALEGGVDEVVIACDLDGAGLSVIDHIDVVHEIGDAVVLRGPIASLMLEELGILSRLSFWT